MASVDEIEAMLQKDMGQAMPIQSTAAISPTEIGYSWKQLGFDVPVGVAKAGAGLADILSYPVIKGAQLAGVSPETLPTFGMTKLIEAGMQPVAQEYGVRPSTEAQKFIEFVSPSPLSKGKLLGEAVTGGLGYLGSKVGEIVAPESSLTQLALTLGLPVGAKAATAKTITAAGKALQRESFQPRKADLTAARNALVEMPDGDSQTQLTKSLNNIIEGNVLGKSRNPKKLESNLNAANSEIENQIQASLKSAEQKVGPVPPPPFENAQQYVLQGSVPANQMDNYFAEIANLQSSIAKEGKGSLVFLNRQRKSIGESWKNENASDAGFWRAMYQDIKQHIEKYAPEVQSLNKQKQDLVVVRPVIEQASKASEKGLTLNDAIRYFGYTTGGGAVPTLAVATGNYPLAALISAGLGLAATPRGQQITGKALQNLGQAPTSTLALSLAGKTTPEMVEDSLSETVPTTVQKQVSSLTSEQRQKLLELRSQALGKTTPVTESTKQSESIKVGTQDVSIPVGEQYAPPKLVKAVMQVESAGKPKAVSEKGAAGLMQLMPATAKELGVEDRFDPAQNIEGGSRYLQQMINKYKKTDLALAAYNWGQTNLDKAIRKVKAEGKRVTWANIMQVVKVPMETRLYVNKVLNEQETLTEKSSPSLLKTVASFAPVTGEIISAQDAISALQEGEYSNAAINALGVIPAVGLFNRIRKGAKLVNAVSDVAKAAPLIETDILYNRANKALRDIDIATLTSSLKSKQALQNTYAELVDQTRARLTRGYNKGKPKSWIDEQVAYLNENKTKLDAITTEINDTQQLLQNAIGLKQVK